jgi:ABC-type phosphate transport system auxiliary subunit
MKELESRLGKFQNRLEEVEDIVLQLNDPSTQQIAQATAPMDISELENKIVAVEKQLHAALGATQKAALTEGTELCCLPTVHQLSNYIEHARKRVKNIEDIKGTSKCVKLL